MKTFLKYLLIDFAAAIGNMLLSHGVIWLGNNMIMFLQGIVKNSIGMEHLTILLMFALQISINILLYKTLLKKIYSPPEQKNPLLYLLLPIIAIAIWICVFKLLLAIGYEFYFETYLGMLLSLLPLFLLVLFLVSIVYNLFLKKYVGEAYYVYILSILCIITVPIAFFSIVPMV